MSVTIKPDPADLRRLNDAITELARETRKTVRKVMPAQMRLLATDFAAVTRPKGKSQADKESAESKITMKVREVYPHPGYIVNVLNKIEDGVGKRFGGLLKRKKYAEAKQITDKHIPGWRIDVGLFDFGQLHKSMRFKKRVTRRLVVSDYSKVQAYIRQKVKMTGFAKGGFATASRQLGGTRGIPQFATRHKAPGTGRMVESGDKLSVEMINGVSYLREAFSAADESMALSHRTTMVGAVLKRIQDRKIEKALRKSNVS
jgi:hypothetical protein